MTSPSVDGDRSDPVYLNSSGFDPSLFHDRSEMPGRHAMGSSAGMQSFFGDMLQGYLLTAEGGTGWGHAVTMARARELTGPYELRLDVYVERSYRADPFGEDVI